MNIKIFTFFLFIFLSTSLSAQLAYLRLSPSQTIHQRVGATDVTIEFSRPQMKGRQIFGNLVPFGKMWRTGANENTKITFSHRVKIGKTEVEAGTYALFTKPMKEQWDIYLYTDTNNLDVPSPIDSSKLIYLTKVKSNKLDEPEETLTINIYDITETSANLGIQWEHTEVRIPITFFTREAMEKAISKETRQNSMDFGIAAAYYYERDIELEKVKKLQEISMQLKDKLGPWDYNSYGKILYKLGEKEKAIEAITHSLKLAKETKNDYLIKDNQKLLENWKE